MCHGPGQAHTDAEHGDDARSAAGAKLIFSFRANAKENSGRCLQCHDTSRDQSNFNHFAHALNNVSCGECRAIHLAKAADSPTRKAVQSAPAMFTTVPSLPEENRWLTNSLLKESQPELCYCCHADVRAAFALLKHHRLPEGEMK